MDMTVETLNIFEKLVDQTKPFLIISDLDNLAIYHPDYLPEKSNIILFKEQVKSDFIDDQIKKLNAQLNTLRDTDNLDDENYKQRLEITNLILQKQKESRRFYLQYLAYVTKKTEEEIETLLVTKCKEKNSNLDTSAIILEIFRYVNQKIKDKNKTVSTIQEKKS